MFLRKNSQDAIAEFRPYFDNAPVYGHGPSLEDFTAQTPLTVGSPQQVIERTLGFREYAGDYQRQLFLLDHAGLPLKTVLEQLDLLGEEVVPVLRKEFAARRPARGPGGAADPRVAARRRAGGGMTTVAVITAGGKPVLLAATAGSARHSLVLEHAMRPLFSYLRALTVPTAVFAAAEDWAGATPLADRIDRAAGELADLVAGRPPARPAEPTSFRPAAGRGLGLPFPLPVRTLRAPRSGPHPGAGPRRQPWMSSTCVRSTSRSTSSGTGTSWAS